MNFQGKEEEEGGAVSAKAQRQRANSAWPGANTCDKPLLHSSLDLSPICVLSYVYFNDITQKKHG